MGEQTKIEWCDHTFNPWIGCTRVSPACDFCYAESLAQRYGWADWGPGKPRKKTSQANWRQPIIWNRKASADGVRRRVFCASLADVFDTEVPDEWRFDLMELILATPSLDWLLLTKRPKVMAEFFAGNRMLPNIWAGTTVENQKMADLRIPDLLKVPARFRFLSCEPLLEPVDIAWALSPNRLDIAAGFQARGSFSPGLETLRRLDWIITGGESGPNARPSSPIWFRSLRDQCAAAGVPYLHKQNGEYADFGGNATIRLGKKRAGRLLDGKLHDGVPA